jgi:hypothetical protein
MQRRSRFARWALAMAVGAISATAIVPAGAQTAPAGAPATRPEPPKWPDFKEVTKDMTATSGMFTLYRHNPEDPSKDQSRLLCQIPRGLMKADLLFATSISRGPYAGFMWDDYLVRFEMVGRNVVMKVPDARYVQTPGQPVTDAVTRTYTDSYLAAMPIVTMNGADPVVDLGQVLMGPTVGLPIGMSGLFGMSSMAMPRRDLSQYTKVKVFPDNALIDVDLAVGGRGAGGTTLGVSYAFRKLPDARAYQPRVADERVGYFTTVRQDWNIKYHERENIVRYVNRWDIKKKDPSLELSPPDKPIQFIIEKTVPLQWRKYVQDGIAEWNKAYEKLGIVNAIVVQQQTEDNEFANVDPEDARYNFIRWIVTGNAFAMGPSRADPRTGQILDADIIFDDSLLRVYWEDFDIFGPGPVSTIMGPELPQFLAQNPAFIPAGQTPEQVMAAAKNTAGELLYQSTHHAGQAGGPKPNVSARMRSHATCNFAAGLKHQMAFTNIAATATGKKIPDKFIGEQIKHITAHEVGHTLGLRHNFKSSSWLSLEEIRRRRDNTDEPTFGSVMDYNPILFFAGDDVTKMRHVVTPCIGPYDYWAIEYGYKTPGREDGSEKEMLAKIGQQGTKREHAYATDEDVMGMTSPDPLANRFDMGENPLDWARTRVELCDALMKDIKKWAIRKDEPSHYLRQTFMTIMFERARNMLYVSRLVGGQLHNRNRPGDPEAKPALVLLDPKQQRDAIAMLGETIFKDEFFMVEPELLNDLGPSRWWDWASTTDTRLDLPVHQMINSLQSYALLNLTSPQALQRVYDAELKSKAEDKFTAAELVVAVRQMIWGGLNNIPEDAQYTNAKPLFTSIRRNLQKQHLQYLLATADSQPGRLVSPDLRNMVRFALRELSEQIGSVQDRTKSGANGSRLDFATRAHLNETKSEIDRVLDAPHIKMPSLGGLGSIILLGADGQPVSPQQYQQLQPPVQGEPEMRD